VQAGVVVFIDRQLAGFYKPLRKAYRQGIAAIRKKDFHLAVDELDAASKLDPANERIYMARERARQELNSSNAARTTP